MESYDVDFLVSRNQLYLHIIWVNIGFVVLTIVMLAWCHWVNHHNPHNLKISLLTIKNCSDTGDDYSEYSQAAYYDNYSKLIHSIRINWSNKLSCIIKEQYFCGTLYIGSNRQLFMHSAGSSTSLTWMSTWCCTPSDEWTTGIACMGPA